MPWPSAFRSKATIPFALAVLALSALVSCTTVASTTPETRAPQLTTVAAAATPSALPRPSVEATPSPAPTAAPTAAPASPVVTPSPAAEVTPSPEAAGPTLDEQTVAKLQKILDNQVKNKDVAGLQAAVRLPSGEMWLGTAGVAEYSPDRALDDDDQLAIASVTKTFVAALILQLAEEGKIDLDAPFGRYFRDAPRKDRVTVRQLLSHTSGIYNYWANPRYGETTRAWWESPNAGGLKARTHRWTYEEMMDLVKSGEFKPGKDYQYSNTNYLILGKVAEAVEGMPLHKQLRQRFFRPLGLDDTIYQPAQKPRADAAHGHWAWPGGHTDHTRDSRYVPFMAAASIADAAGAMASNARDLAEWSAALYGGEVLSDEMLAEMTTFRRPGNYGLGAYPAAYSGHLGIGHRGGIRGYESSMFYFPRTGVSVVLLSNQGNWAMDEPMRKLVRTVLGRK